MTTCAGALHTFGNRQKAGVAGKGKGAGGEDAEDGQVEVEEGDGALLILFDVAREVVHNHYADEAKNAEYGDEGDEAQRLHLLGDGEREEDEDRDEGHNEHPLDVEVLPHELIGS